MTATPGEIDTLIGKLIESCADDEDPEVCGECLEALIAAGKAALPRLLGLLDHPWADVRLRAVEALGRIGDPSVVPALERAMDADPDTDVQGFAADALSRLQANRSVRRLIRALGTTDPGKRVDTVIALARLRAREAVPALLALAQQMDRDGRPGGWVIVRASVIYIEHGVNGLIAVLASVDQDADLSRGAATLLGEIPHRESIPILVDCVKRDDEPLRSQALASLDYLNAQLKLRGTDVAARMVPVLIKVLTSDASDRCRMQAAYLLKSSGDPRALPALEMAASGDVAQSVRGAAARAVTAIRRAVRKGEATNREARRE